MRYLPPPRWLRFFRQLVIAGERGRKNTLAAGWFWGSHQWFAPMVRTVRTEVRGR